MNRKLAGRGLAAAAAAVVLGFLVQAQAAPTVTSATKFTPLVWSETQLATRAAPTLATEGISLEQMGKCKLSVCAKQGCFLDGGTIRSWDYDPTRADGGATFGNGPERGWSASTDTLSISTSWGQCQHFVGLTPAVALGKHLFAASGVAIMNPDGGFDFPDGGDKLSMQMTCTKVNP